MSIIVVRCCCRCRTMPVAAFAEVEVAIGLPLPSESRDCCRRARGRPHCRQVPPGRGSVARPQIAFGLVPFEHGVLEQDFLDSGIEFEAWTAEQLDGLLQLRRQRQVLGSLSWRLGLAR